MSGYGYGPPPPPPPSSTPSYGHLSASYPQQGQSRGGSGGSQSSRGRGGQYPRPRDYHAPPAAHYDYTSQPYPTHQGPVSYGAAHTPVGTYPPHPSQWSSDHGAHASHATHPHAPTPLSSANYHPNYAPPAYPSPSQHSQPPSYGSSQSYGQSYQAHPAANVPHWSPQGPPQPLHYSGNRGRGGYGDRGSHKSPQSGAPGRHGYDPEPLPLAAPYGQPYPSDPRALHYPSPSFPYQRPPPPPSSGARQDHRSGQHSRRGRGSGQRDGVRGRGGHHNNGNHHHAKARHNNHNRSNQNENKPKPETPSVGKKKKRKVNTLGLTPGAESESEDDEGEEKALTELIGTETLQISDVSAFLAERRKNYPTKARVTAKKAAQVAQKAQDKTTDLEKQADRLRKQLAKVEFSIKRKREQGDEGDEMRDTAGNLSGDEKPEVMSSRAKPSTPAAPSAKRADITRHCKYYSTGGTCGKKGKCRFVHDPEVREAAIKEREANNGRLTIQQRLILNDKEQEDLTVLQSIQYIRQSGLMESEIDAQEEQEASQNQNQDQNVVKPAPTTSSASLLPAAPASLPAPPPKKEPIDTDTIGLAPSEDPAESASNGEEKPYEGWLLQPYGSPNGDQSKTDDLP